MEPAGNHTGPRLPGLDGAIAQSTRAPTRASALASSHSGRAGNPSGGAATLIILTLYLVLVWLIIFKLKLVKWGWGSGTVAVLIGVFILAVFLAMFNYLTPSGKFVIVSRVVEVTPNVSGQVMAIPVKTNVPVKAGTVLFEIDPAPCTFPI